VILLIGAVAEAKFMGTRYAPDIDSPTSSDEQNVFGRIVEMRALHSGSDEDLLAELLAAAESLATTHWLEIERVAAQLLDHGTLSGEQVRAVMIGASG
jgi:hypothetical protein